MLTPGQASPLRASAAVAPTHGVRAERSKSGAMPGEVVESAVIRAKGVVEPERFFSVIRAKGVVEPERFFSRLAHGLVKSMYCRGGR